MQIPSLVGFREKREHPNIERQEFFTLRAAASLINIAVLCCSF